MLSDTVKKQQVGLNAIAANRIRSLVFGSVGEYNLGREMKKKPQRWLRLSDLHHEVTEARTTIRDLTGTLDELKKVEAIHGTLLQSANACYDEVVSPADGIGLEVSAENAVVSANATFFADGFFGRSLRWLLQKSLDVITSKTLRKARVLKPSTRIIAGGEHLVAVPGHGTGGRNQTFMLAARRACLPPRTVSPGVGLPVRTQNSMVSFS
jgi:hypothetical protein